MNPRRHRKPLARVRRTLGSVALAAALSACAQPGPKSVGPPVANAESYGDPVVRSRVRERAVAMLSDAARGSDPLLRANAIEGLIAAPARVEPLVRAALVDENLGVRFVAAMAVGRLALIDSAPFVTPLLNDPSPMVRAGAIFALQKTGAAPDLTPLAGMLKDRDPRVRAQAAFVLGELGNPSATAMLREAAKDDMPRASIPQVRIMRLQIAEALVKLGETDEIETVRAALYPSRPEDFEAAALAVQIIGEVQDRRSVDQLIILTAMKDQYRMPAEVRLGAAGALAQLGQPRGAFIADEYWADRLPALRAQAAFVYGETARAGALGKLDTMMEDQDPVVRIAAAAAAVKAADQLAGVRRVSAGGVGDR